MVVGEAVLLRVSVLIRWLHYGAELRACTRIGEERR